MDNFTKEIKSIKKIQKEILALKNAVSEIKNLYVALVAN